MSTFGMGDRFICSLLIVVFVLQMNHEVSSDRESPIAIVAPEKDFST